MFVCCFGGYGFIFFYCWLVVVFGMNMKFVFVWWQCLQSGGEFEFVVGFGDFDVVDGLIDVLVGYEIKLYIFINGLCVSVKCEG